jgi:hypothetical protein
MEAIIYRHYGILPVNNNKNNNNNNNKNKNTMKPSKNVYIE